MLHSGWPPDPWRTPLHVLYIFQVRSRERSMGSAGLLMEMDDTWATWNRLKMDSQQPIQLPSVELGACMPCSWVPLKILDKILFIFLTCVSKCHCLLTSGNSKQCCLLSGRWWGGSWHVGGDGKWGSASGGHLCSLCSFSGLAEVSGGIPFLFSWG